MVKAMTFTAPAAWASYYVNRDASGLTLGERKRADVHLKKQLPKQVNILDVVACDDEPKFTWFFSLHGGDSEGGDILEYTALYTPKVRLEKL